MYLADAVVASWFLKKEVVGLNTFAVMTNIFVTEFSENILGKTQNMLHIMMCVRKHLISTISD